MTPFFVNWEQFLISTEPLGFLIEVALRTLIMYIGLLVALTVFGKRGVIQRSIFELVIIIGFGSAAGDPMFYNDLGILNAIVVFMAIIALCKLTTHLVTHSEYVGKLIEGEPICLLLEGRFSILNFDKETLGYDNFFSEMRQQVVSHLKQLQQAIIEVS